MLREAAPADRQHYDPRATVCTGLHTTSAQGFGVTTFRVTLSNCSRADARGAVRRRKVPIAAEEVRRELASLPQRLSRSASCELNAVGGEPAAYDAPAIALSKIIALRTKARTLLRVDFRNR
jgi:hypothetical protein